MVPGIWEESCDGIAEAGEMGVVRDGYVVVVDFRPSFGSENAKEMSEYYPLSLALSILFHKGKVFDHAACGGGKRGTASLSIPTTTTKKSSIPAA